MPAGATRPNLGRPPERLNCAKSLATGATCWPKSPGSHSARPRATARSTRHRRLALGGRVSRVSFGGASLEFVAASEAPSTVVSAVTEFIDATAARPAGSDAGPSLQTTIYSTGADFVKINLGSGRSWLTTRLFIFAVIFSETASVKKIVFVQESDAGVETFAGVADPLAVANRLGSRFRWLSSALADAERPFMAEQWRATLRPIRPGACAVIWRERRSPATGRRHMIAYYRCKVPPTTSGQV